MDPAMHFTPGMAVGALIGAIVMVFIGALILMLINRLVNGFWGSYWRCFATVIVVGIVVGIIGFILGKLVGPGHTGLLMAVGVVLETLIGGAIMNAFVKRKDGGPIGYARCAIVFLIYAILGSLLSAGSQHLMQAMQAKLPAPPAH